MGSTYAMGLKESEAMGLIRLENAIRIHLTANHYPPIPAGFSGLALKAIELANLGEWDEEIELDEGAYINGSSTITVSDAVEKMHLEFFLEPDDV